MTKNAFQKITHGIFYDVESKQFVWVNNFLALLTLISVFAIVIETVEGFREYHRLFQIVEYTSVFFFTLEYIGRIIAQRRDVLSYIFSFFGVIDLLAIVPTYFGLTNLTFLKTARVLRILRLLRMIRLAKIANLGFTRKRDVEHYSHLYRLNISIYFFALLSAIIFFGTAIYVFEGTSQTFANIPLSMLWAVKPLLGGIPQVMPTTLPGELISILARFTGLILFGLLIAIIGNTVHRLLFGTEKVEPPRQTK